MGNKVYCGRIGRGRSRASTLWWWKLKISALILIAALSAWCLVNARAQVRVSEQKHQAGQTILVDAGKRAGNVYKISYTALPQQPDQLEYVEDNTPGRPNFHFHIYYDWEQYQKEVAENANAKTAPQEHPLPLWHEDKGAQKLIEDYKQLRSKPAPKPVSLNPFVRLYSYFFGKNDS